MVFMIVVVKVIKYVFCCFLSWNNAKYDVLSSGVEFGLLNTYWICVHPLSSYFVLSDEVYLKV